MTDLSGIPYNAEIYSWSITWEQLFGAALIIAGAIIIIKIIELKKEDKQ